MISDYGYLVFQGQMVVVMVELEEIGFQICICVQDLGYGCIFLVQKVGVFQVCFIDSYIKRELIECVCVVMEKVFLVFLVFQVGNKGIQVCIIVVIVVFGIIVDLDIIIMFVIVGMFNVENSEIFVDYRENIFKIVKVLVEDMKLFVLGVVFIFDKLVQVVQFLVVIIIQFVEVVKLGVVSLGFDDFEIQVVLINVIKDVVKVFFDFISVIKGVVSKLVDDFFMYQFKGVVKVMVINVIFFFKIVKVVEDEVIWGIRVFEVIIECIKQEFMLFQLKDVFEKILLFEEFIRMMKGIIMVIIKVVVVGNFCRQEDVIVIVNLSWKVVLDMLMVCK